MKFLTYAILVFFAYIIQTIPDFMSFFGVSPILVLPACICIAVYEGEFAGGLFGFFAGLLCDSTSETVFGFNSCVYLLFCVAAGLATIYIFRRSTLNIMLLCLTAIFLRSSLEFFFEFILYGYENLEPFFYTVFAPQIVYTSVFSFPFCILFKKLHRHFEPDETRE